MMPHSSPVLTVPSLKKAPTGLMALPVNSMTLETLSQGIFISDFSDCGSDNLDSGLHVHETPSLSALRITADIGTRQITHKEVQFTVFFVHHPFASSRPLEERVCLQWPNSQRRRHPAQTAHFRVGGRTKTKSVRLVMASRCPLPTA